MVRSRRRGRYKVVINRLQAKRLVPLDKRKADNELSYCQSLGENPRPFGCEKLSGHLDRYRVREDNYRILYSIDDEKLLVDVVKVGHRKDVYR